MKIADSIGAWRRRLPALILPVAVAAMLPPALTAADVARTTITVRVYQTAGLSSALEQRALAEAKALLGTAGVDVCGADAPAARPQPASRRWARPNSRCE